VVLLGLTVHQTLLCPDPLGELTEKYPVCSFTQKMAKDSK